MSILDKDFDPENSVFIIDGHSMIYRAYFALTTYPGSKALVLKLLKN